MPKRKRIRIRVPEESACGSIASDIADEDMAFENYSNKARLSRNVGDEESGEMYENMAEDEYRHSGMNKRILKKKCID